MRGGCPSFTKAMLGETTMVERNPPCDGQGRNIEGDDIATSGFALNEVRMFAGDEGVHHTGFNTGYYETQIEFRRWNGKKWELIRNPALPRQAS